MPSACKCKGTKKGSSVKHMGKKINPYPQPRTGSMCLRRWLWKQGTVKSPETAKHQCYWVEGPGQCGTACFQLRENLRNMAWNLLFPSVKAKQAKCRECPCWSSTQVTQVVPAEGSVISWSVREGQPGNTGMCVCVTGDSWKILWSNAEFWTCSLSCIQRLQETNHAHKCGWWEVAGEWPAIERVLQPTSHCPISLAELSAPHGSTHPVVWNCVNT